MEEPEDNKMQQESSPEVSSKLTDWKDEPTLQNLKNDLEMATPSQNAQVGKINSWNDLLHVRNGAKPKSVKGRSSVQPKLIRRQAEWRYSALTEPFLSSEKIFKVTPVTFEDADASKQNELVLNWQFRTKLNKIKFVDDMVRSTVDEGTCIIRTGWDRQTVIIKEDVPVWSYFQITNQNEFVNFQKALAFKSENPRGFEENLPEEIKESVRYYEETGVPVVAEITGTESVDVEKVIENKPVTTILNPANVFIDPSCEGDFSKAMFVVVSFETNLSELEKQKGRYKNLDQIDWEHVSVNTETNHETSTPTDFQFKDKYRRKAVAYEYWGFYNTDGNDEGRLTPIVVTWIGNTIIRMEESPYPDKKLPFVVIPYLPVKREVYGEPDAELLEDNQKILGAVSRGMIDLLGRSANGQQGFAKGMLDPLNKRRFDDGEDYEFNPNMPTNLGHIQHTYPEIPNSALTMMNLQNVEAESLTGVKSFSGGMSGEAYGDVATGIRGMLDAASKREMAILRRIAKGLTDIGRKIIAMNAEFLSEKEVIRVTNEQYVDVYREELAGEFDLEVDISTAEVDNAKAQDLAFMLQTIGPNTDFGIVAMILADIADLKRMPELAEKVRNFRPEPSPEEQKRMQLEIQKLELENEEILSKIRLNDARAQKELSSKDKNDLDYVEQETGTKHARDLERQKAQSQGNQNLQITKALTSPTKEGESAPDIDAALGWNVLSDRLSNAI